MTRATLNNLSVSVPGAPCTPLLQSLAPVTFPTQILGRLTNPAFYNCRQTSSTEKLNHELSNNHVLATSSCSVIFTFPSEANKAGKKAPPYPNQCLSTRISVCWQHSNPSLDHREGKRQSRMRNLLSPAPRAALGSAEDDRTVLGLYTTCSTGTHLFHHCPLTSLPLPYQMMQGVLSSEISTNGYHS